MDAVRSFLEDPLVIPVVSLLILAVIDFLLGIYRSIQQGQFDWEKLPQVLDTVVLQKVIPLVALGAAAFFAGDPLSGGLKAAYLAASTAALAAEVKAIIDKTTGSYVASSKTSTDGVPPPSTP